MSGEFPVHDEVDGVSFGVAVVPRASRSKIVGVHGAVLKVALAAAPVDGEANDALRALLGKALRVPTRDVRITHGEHSKNKRVTVVGVDSVNARALLVKQTA